MAPTMPPPPGSPGRSLARRLATPRGERAAAALLLACFAALCAHGLVRDSPTVDEFAHLPDGVYIWRTGDVSLFPLNPPLVKMLAALPLLPLRPDIDTSPQVEHTGWYPWVFGTDFMERNRAAYERLFEWGRVPVVALGVLLGIAIWRWARRLYGPEGGLLALFLYAFCPAFVAHAHLATVDVGLALATLLALAAWERLLRRPSAAAALVCGVALGVAQLTKFTAVLLVPIVLLLGAVELARGRRFRPLPALGTLALVFTVALLVLDAGYLFQDVGRRAGDFRFASGALRALFAALPPALPVPLPASYLVGFDALQRINEVGEYPTYLFGRIAYGAAPAYFPVSILLKTPLPLLLAWLAAPFARRGRAQGERYLWLAALVLLAVFCFASRVHYGIRYVLPVLALAIVYAGRLAPQLWGRHGAGEDGGETEESGETGDRGATPRQTTPETVPTPRWHGERRAIRAAAALLLALYPLSIVLATPDTIDYFNVLAAGQGDAFLLDSNLDWGQGLERLAAWMEEEGVERVGLAYFGHVDPALYGIAWEVPYPGLAWSAVSANFLHGLPYATYMNGRIVPVPAGAFTWLAVLPERRYLGGGIFLVRTGGAVSRQSAPPDARPNPVGTAPDPEE